MVTIDILQYSFIFDKFDISKDITFRRDIIKCVEIDDYYYDISTLEEGDDPEDSSSYFGGRIMPELFLIPRKNDNVFQIQSLLTYGEMEYADAAYQILRNEVLVQAYKHVEASNNLIEAVKKADKNFPFAGYDVQF